MDRALISNIQRFSLHDGQGIRTTIFFKGCGLACIWCHNPENQKYHPQLMRYQNKCKNCGLCMENCPHRAIYLYGERLLHDSDKCQLCGLCTDFCAYDVLDMVGKYYTVDQLVEEIKKDIIFYEESNGGVTFSGGEVMSQSIEFLLDLSKRLERLGIKINVDTCGLAPWISFKKIAPYVDTFLYDIKTFNRQKHLKYIGEGLELIQNNLIRLNDLNAKINIRLPIISGVNDGLEEIKEIRNWLIDRKINPCQINLLAYHKMGSGKYEGLGMEYYHDLMDIPGEERMKEIRDLFKRSGFNNIILGG